MDQEKKMNVWEIAEYLFGPMRTSTDEELELERQMMQRLTENAEPFGKNIFDDDFQDLSDRGA